MCSGNPKSRSSTGLVSVDQLRLSVENQSGSIEHSGEENEKLYSDKKWHGCEHYESSTMTTRICIEYAI